MVDLRAQPRCQNGQGITKSVLAAACKVRWLNDKEKAANGVSTDKEFEAESKPKADEKTKQR